MNLYSMDNVRSGKVRLDIDTNGTIKQATLLEGAIGFTDVPIFDITNDGTGKNLDALLNLNL